MSATAPLKVLLIEDSPSEAKIARQVLREIGSFEVSHVERLSEAIERLQSGSEFDVTLVDLGLPDSSGLETVTRLRGAAPWLPMVVLTGHASDELGIAAVSAGAQDYLIKGLSDGFEICRALRHAIERHHLVLNLNERVKELRGLHSAALLLREETLPIAELLQRFAELIPPSFQFPELTAAKVTFGDSECQTKNFRDSPWVLPAHFRAADGTEGQIEVLYLGSKRPKAADPFLPEEQTLVSSLAEMLRAHFESRLATARIRESEQQFRILFQSNPHPMWVYDRETYRFLAVNDIAVTKYGYARDELLNMEIFEVHPQEDVETLRIHLATVTKGYRHGMIWRHKLKNGGLIDVEISSQDIIFGGRPARFILALDVTQRLASERLLRASETRLRTIVDTEPECVKLVSLDGNILEMNRSGLRLVEANSAQEVIGKPVLSLIHPEDHPAFESLHQQACKGETGQLAYRVIGLAGKLRWVETHATPLREPDGSIASVLSVTRDITQRHQAETALAESERRFRLILQAVGEGVHGVDREDRIIFENPAALAMFGYEESEMLGQYAHTLVHHHYADGRPYPLEKCPIQQTLRDGQTRHADEVYFRKDGSSFPVALTCAAIRDEQGTITGAVVSFVDVTQRLAIERERTELLKREQAARREADAASRYYRSLFESAPGCYLVLEPENYRIVAASDAFLTATMSTRAQIQGKQLFEAFPDDPDDPTADGTRDLRESLERVKATGRTDVMAVHRYPIRLPEAEGGGFVDRYWTPVNSPVPGPDGEIAYIIHRVEDVTEYVQMRGQQGEAEAKTQLASRAELLEADIVLRSVELKRANEQLAQSQGLLRVASNLGKLGGWRVTLPAAHVEWSDETCAIHEVPPGYMPTVEEALEFYPPEHREKIRSALVRCVSEGVSFEEECELVTAKGRRIWIRAIGEAVKDSQEAIVAIQGALQDIHEQKLADLRALELSERLTHTLEHISDAFFTLDLDWRFTFLNARAVELLARPLEELLGKVLWDEFPAALGTAFESEYRKAMEGKVTVQFEERYSPQDVWYSVRAYPSEIGLAVYFHDVSEVRQAREALRESEARFREMAENINDVFYNVDPIAGKTLYVSPSYERIWGRSCQSLYEKPMEYIEAIHPEDQAIAQEAYDRHFHGETTNVQYRVLRPDGEIRWIRDLSYPLMGQDGKLIRVVGSARDITESRLAEESMRVSEERFRNLAKATNDAIWDWDLQSDAVWWNEGLLTQFGFHPDEVEPTSHSWTSRIHPEDRDRILADIHRAIDGDKEFWTGEYRYLRKDGKYAYVVDRGYVIRDANGKAIRMVGGMTDLTEKKNLEGQLFQSQKMEAIGHLAGGVAHDFNNLLTVINGYSEILMTMLPPDSESRAMLGQVRDAGERAANLTGQLLAFSRKQVLAPKVLDLNEVIENLEKMLKRLIGEDIRIATVLRPSLAKVRADQGQLEQVIFNLAVNARDAMPMGGQLTIETANLHVDEAMARSKADLRPGDYVSLSVSDAGTGMSADVLAHIFEPFFTTKAVGKGTGLGLATVFGIIKQSEGTIDVYSELGIGSRFRILLPAIEEADDAGAQVDASIPLGKESVLLVEDEPGVRAICKLALETHGYQVLEATSGREALEFVVQSPGIDLLVTDVIMPGMSGRELVENVRLLEPQIRVIYMSGYTDDAIVRHGILEANDAFLQKPFSPLTLARKVREVLDSR